MRVSVVRHTSTSATESALGLRPVSCGTTCALAPKNTRDLSRLHESGARSLSTHSFCHPAAFAGSSTAGAASGLLNASRTFGHANNTFARSRMRSTAFPLSTAMPLPSFVQAMRE